MRILFTGGGTGGHIFPIISVSEKLKEIAPDSEFFYVGSPGIYEAELIKADIKTKSIASAKLRRYFDLRNFIDAPKFLFSIFQAFWKIFWIMPDVLFSKGGPGAFPVVLASWFYRVSIVIHDSDAFAGYQNLLSGKFASIIGTSFDISSDSFVNFYKKESKRQKIADKIFLVGNPIRSFFLNEADTEKEKLKTVLGFDLSKKLILVVSGSQGSVRVNDFFVETALDLLSANFQIFHQTGLNNLGNFNKELSFVLAKSPEIYKSSYKTTAFLADKSLRDAMAAADLIVSRSGSFIFEIAATGKPSILIPLPESAADHQKKNAYEYAKTGAAVVIEEENLTPHLFLTQVNKIFGSQENYNVMSLAAKKFSKPDAAKLLAGEIIKLSTRG